MESGIVVKHMCMIYISRCLTWLMLSCTVAYLGAATPEQCVQDYYSAVTTSGLTEALQHVHPSELGELRRLTAGVKGPILGNETNSESVDIALSDLEWCRKIMPSFQRLQEPILALKKTAKLETIGHVTHEGISYVVIRWRMNIVGTEIVKLAVEKTKQFEGRALMMLPEEIMQSARLMSAQFTGPTQR